MKPPMFSLMPAGANAQQYLHRARQFREAAIGLPASRNGEQNWPMYALLTHAIELALKAYALHSVGAGPTKNKPPGNHDLVGWYILAVSYGLENEPTISKGIGFLNELHETHFMRYPTRPSGPIHDCRSDGGPFDFCDYPGGQSTLKTQPPITRGRPLVSPGFAGCHVAADRRQRRARPRGLPERCWPVLTSTVSITSGFWQNWFVRGVAFPSS